MTTMHNPPHPGEFIHDTYIEPLDISLREAALKLDVSPSTFSRLVRGDSDISPIMAALKHQTSFSNNYHPERTVFINHH